MALFLDENSFKRVKFAFDYIKSRKAAGNFSNTDAISFLSSDYCKGLDRDEKNFVYSFFYPRPLLDMELPIRVAKSRTSRKVSKDSTPNLVDVGLILEASRTEQYSRFLYHLFYAFGNQDFLYRMEEGEYNCPICGRKLTGFKEWDQEKDSVMTTLAIGSEKSAVVLCKNCISHLNAAKELIQKLNPEFFRYG